MLTQSRLKEILHYNLETGFFTWIETTAKCISIGDVAGSINKVKSGKKYVSIRIYKKLYYAHRLAFLYVTGSFPENETDHINGDGMDNRWANLRKVTRQGNSRNHRLMSTNTSGHVGISWHKKDKKWVSRVKINGKLIHLGNFDDINDAILARKSSIIDKLFHLNHGEIRPL